MKFPSTLSALYFIPPVLIATLSAQDADIITKWDVQLPPPIVQEEENREVPAVDPVPIQFDVLTSRTKEVYVQETPEMPDLPPVEGKIKVTIQKVADPGLPDPPPPLPALPPDDPAVIARMEELRETYRGTELIFVSSSVYMETKDSPECRTLLRIYPNGQTGNEVVAWTNLNLLHLCGQGGYRLNLDDGTYQDFGLLMGISPIYIENMRRLAATHAGREYQEPEIPELPDLATAGPSFVLVEGDAASPAYATLEQIHDLFRLSGDTIKAQHLAREQARVERKAFLLANPPKPKDVTIRVWRRTPTQISQEQAR
ncbi:hypothetical protein [Haloferula sargassicola]|uniref:Uncharacterized protein n=1 Tax=Haloferula sargassicola TaxID=490096 RepID=A0ABP9UQX2_9BACT